MTLVEFLAPLKGGKQRDIVHSARTFLEALPDLGILDKAEKDTLVDGLNLRNRCGHPTKVKPGINKARSFIEDVVGIVFT